MGLSLRYLNHQLRGLVRPVPFLKASWNSLSISRDISGRPQSDVLLVTKSGTQ
jgi:hypothetical protein